MTNASGNGSPAEPAPADELDGSEKRERRPFVVSQSKRKQDNQEARIKEKPLESTRGENEQEAGSG